MGLTLVLGACGAAPTGLAASPATTALTSSSVVIPPGAVPWADLPPGRPALPRPVPTTAPPATAPPCTPAELSVTADGRNGGGGNVVHYYELQNRGPTTCLLGGYPRLVATEPGHRPVVAADGTSFGDGGPPGDLAPGMAGELSVQTEDFCGADPGGGPQPVYHHATVTLPSGGSLALPDVAFPVTCALRVAAFAWPLPPPVEPPDPAAALEVGIEAPRHSTAGTTTVYTVTLVNPTSAAVLLHPCPSYVQTIEGLPVKVFHQLDCAEARPVPAHGHEVFVMHLAVPDAAPSGATTLGWSLLHPGQGHARAPVTVQADPSRPRAAVPPDSPAPCAASPETVQPPPCGPGAQIDVRYPYAIDTSCGLTTVVLDGGLWTPTTLPPGTEAGRPPYGWGDPVEAGSITVSKPGVSAQFVGAPGHRLDFLGPAVRAASPPPPC